jgi:hypothetical protein
MRQLVTKTRNIIVLLTILVVLAALNLSAQKHKYVTHASILPDSSINPHDFNDQYYYDNGVQPKFLLERRNGIDFLSVFDKSDNPIHSDVRVLITLPAYDELGRMIFFVPLSRLNTYGFRDDEKGAAARDFAKSYPIYIFPNNYTRDDWAFNNNRQAALIYNPSEVLPPWGNPLGLRTIVTVRYSERALKDGHDLMGYMAKKNGLSIDGTPIIKTLEDMNLLNQEGLLVLTDQPNGPIEFSYLQYSVTPVIADPRKGAIAPDAFLFMANQNGQPLDAEMPFVHEFNCLQKTGDWCTH